MRAAALAAPLLVAAVQLAATTGRSGLVFALALPIGVACVHRGRLALSTPAQVLALLGAGLVAFLATTFWPSTRGLAEEILEPGWTQLGQAALLLAGTRLHVARPVGGPGATLGLGLLVFLACGTVRTGDLYPALLVAYAALAFVALRIEDLTAGGRAPRAFPGRRTLAAALVVGAVAFVLTAGLARAIPRFYALAYSWALDWVDDRHRAGFHDGPMRLGSLDGLLESNDVVMRVEGDAGDHLRGNVYTHYVRGRWLPAPRRDERTLRTGPAEAAAAPDATVRAVVRSARGAPDRFFVPSVPGALRLSPDEVRVDPMGVVRPAGQDGAERIVLMRSGDRSFPPAPPGEADRALPEGLTDLLSRLQSEWAGGGASPRARIDTIRARLEADYVYSLDFEHRDGSDALAAFLTEGRAGHCEYFASSMTLLARAAGVPARLVTGYRVAERNPFGGYAVVRERHAHAWSEVHLDGEGWVTIDPSPLRGRAPAEAEVTPWLVGLIDWGIVAWQRRGIEVLLGTLVVGLAIAQIVRIARGRSRQPRAARSGVQPPPDWLVGLLDGLAAVGLTRRASEPLESLARRARSAAQAGDADSVALGEAALLLGRYTAVRYGGEGSVDALRADFVRWVERMPGAEGDGSAARPTRASP